MKYKGGKGRIADEILAIMLNSMLPDQTFIDAFCGGCAVIQRVPREYRRIANDNNRYLIAMLQRLTTDDKWKPTTDIPRNFYNDVRTSYYADDGRYDDALIGWVGWMASRNGRFFDGGYSGFGKDGRDYIGENIRNITRQLDDLRGVEWFSGDYAAIPIPPESLIYCDPPYKGTTGYRTGRGFDYPRFYDWCRKMKKEGHQVFVSEYQMPPDFDCIWEKELTNSLHPTKTMRPTERLWTIKKKRDRLLSLSIFFVCYINVYAHIWFP